jgi:L-fuconolactonase
MRIDAHQHFWQYTPDMEWITPAMSAIRKNFSAADLLPVLQESHIDGCITVEVDQTAEETRQMLAIAAENDFIKGVVGWVDLRAEDIDAQLTAYQPYSLLKGFRHILQAEPPSRMLEPDFLRGIAALGKHGYVYEILIYPEHLEAALELVKRSPNQSFIIDHLAKPFIKEKKIDEWAKGMRALAAFDQVHCKVSGMVSEADWENHQQADFVPYLDVVAEAFGTKRLIFGSDWPVCLTAASYNQVVGIVEHYFSADERKAVMGENAIRFYHLS